MELTEREQTIVDMAVERALLMLPEVMNSLVQNKVAAQKLMEGFYKANPTFASNRDIVGSVIEDLDDKNPGKAFKDILDMATPIIKERIGTISGLDMKKGIRPKKEELVMESGDNGII